MINENGLKIGMDLKCIGGKYLTNIKGYGIIQSHRIKENEDMTRNAEIIEHLLLLKECAVKNHNDTGIIDVKIDNFNFVIDMAIQALEQEPKTGHWIEDEYEMEVRCSACGEENDMCSKYCPNCGARMDCEVKV